MDLTVSQVVAITTLSGRFVEFSSYVVYFLITKPDYLLGKGNIFYVPKHIWKSGTKTTALIVPGDLLYQVFVITQSYIIAHYGGKPGDRLNEEDRISALAGVNVVLMVQELFWSLTQGFLQ